MSRENVELVRAMYQAFNHNDWEALLQACTPDIAVQRAGGAGTVRGHEALRQFTAADAFESQELDPQEFIEYKDKLLVTLWARARGKGSAIEVEQRGFHVLTLRDGRIAQVDIYFEKADALEALHRTRGIGPRP
jgi:ketosteroid isomerase-like protein